MQGCGRDHCLFEDNLSTVFEYYYVSVWGSKVTFQASYWSIEDKVPIRSSTGYKVNYTLIGNSQIFENILNQLYESFLIKILC